MNMIINSWAGTNENYTWYIALVLCVLVIPVCLVRDITKFTFFHLLGDIAILATLIVLGYEAIHMISIDKNFNFDHLYLINSDWAKMLGMAVTSLEGVGVVLPIKV